MTGCQRGESVSEAVTLGSDAGSAHDKCVTAVRVTLLGAAL